MLSTLPKGICVRNRPNVPPGLSFAPTYRNFSFRDRFFKVSEEVQEALETRKPIVALETTIYTHGYPYPENVALASHLESLVRVNGVVPATIGILNGVARVGMSTEELIELVSTAGRPETLKVSRRDLGYITGLGLAGKKLNGGTTISGTMILSHLAGIRVFATGGLGGVHRGGENSLDISADLTELGRTPVAVVSAGCKSFLDLPRTLEYLETQGVGIATFADGRKGSVDIPAFYVRDSGIRSPRTIKDEAEAAAIIYAQYQLPINSGIWLAGPVPEKDSLKQEEVQEWVREAVDEAAAKGIHGAANTPYILDRIKFLSKGRSVIANRAGISANVVRGAKVAVELARLESPEGNAPSRDASNEFHMLNAKVNQPSRVLEPESTRYDVFVAGALAVDLNCDYLPLAGDISGSRMPSLRTSNPAELSQSAGGVGHNVALAAHYAGASTLLCSAVGDDMAGHTLIDQVRRKGLSVSGVQVLGNTRARTAQYVAINDLDKDLFVAAADMSILSSPTLDHSHYWEQQISRYQPKWVVVDANWSTPIISHIVKAAKLHGAVVAFEPVSVQKSNRLVELLKSDDTFPSNHFDLITPNSFELESMFIAAQNSQLFESNSWWRVINSLNLPGAGASDRLARMTSPGLVDRGVPQQSLQLLPYIPRILTKLGPLGCLLTQLLLPNDTRLQDPEYTPYILSRADGEDSVSGGIYLRLFPPAEVLGKGDVVSVNGAGDTLMGVAIAGLVRQIGENRVEDVILDAQKAAAASLRRREAVTRDLRGILGTNT